MGCDIHFYTERQLGNGRWVNIDNWRHETGERAWACREIYSSRHYSMFALLADVRNNGEIVPIAQPRGWPDNVSALTQGESDSYGVDGHSHSYFTLYELREAVRLPMGNYLREVLCRDIIIPVEERFREESWVYREETLTKEQMESVRILFFFDN